MTPTCWVLVGIPAPMAGTQPWLGWVLPTSRWLEADVDAAVSGSTKGGGRHTDADGD